MVMGGLEMHEREFVFDQDRLIHSGKREPGGRKSLHMCYHAYYIHCLHLVAGSACSSNEGKEEIRWTFNS